MTTRTITILIITGLIGLAGILFLLTSPSQNSSSEETTEQSVALESYTTEQVRSHISKNDCWTIINNSVYNITSYVSAHPGGDEILKACGEDSTTLFNSRTDEDGDSIGSGTPHSSSAEKQLEKLKIGTLGQ
jgi:cytochrome b involved in lipid metabolism